MAIIVGKYKDKGRNLDILTSILDLRIRDYPVDSSISLDPLDEKFADVGEFVLKGETSVSRPAANTVAGLGTGMPKIVQYERGGTDVQNLLKMPVIDNGTPLEAKFRLWIADATDGIHVGDELGVVFVDGGVALTGGDVPAAADLGFTGIKGILFPIRGTSLAAAGNDFIKPAPGTGLRLAAGDDIWVVGVATSACAANGDVLKAEIYSTPVLRSLIA